ncbi:MULTISPECIES: hypothetical protein [Okeania]|uniref:Universal stress protein n=1 Tax=Okeania hirsuta TaxID=1458930 RepID=A0A3N6NSA9_9CYAN|nr:MULTISPECIES: hypothetical protein [Okeania]NEP06893.1 hypothetical protein [Okeania sp. SIO4D6]NET17479.1 hypothetical protein [Okeania sp. SIO1H6]NEP75651.1 hypothetical protein [Okeania sp. SIO2G5]NEP96782.1 hypothetical protein [Okeania sp. SIO2F5]NEQ94811.1 hypothetical protein [Okeania sp. SIO2G4]
MNIWLVVANPYAYDKAMWKGISEAQQNQAKLRVVFFINNNSINDVIGELGQTGWLGSNPLHKLQDSMLEGYRALASDVLKRVKRKAKEKEVELDIQEVIERPSLEEYLFELVEQDAIKIIVAGPQLLTTRVANLPSIAEYIEED